MRFACASTPCEVPRGEYTRIYMSTLYGEFGEMFERSGRSDRHRRRSRGPLSSRTSPIGTPDPGDRLGEANVAASYWSCLAAHAPYSAWTACAAFHWRPSSAACTRPSGGRGSLAGHLQRHPHAAFQADGLDEQEFADRGYTI